MDTLWEDLMRVVMEPRGLRENLATLVNNNGALSYVGVGLIVFCETGLVVTPFLPGDSLLFVTGFICATVESASREAGRAPSVTAVGMGLVLLVAAIVGDAVNYHIGRWIGPRAFSGRIRFLKREYLDRTHAFFERHGGRAVVIARFVPIVRTFAPFVAGIGSMSYGRFALYNVLGAVVWVGSLMGAGYWLGGLEFVQRHFEKVVLGIIVASLMPLAWEWWSARRGSRRSPTLGDPPRVSRGTHSDTP